MKATVTPMSSLFFHLSDIPSLAVNNSLTYPNNVYEDRKVKACKIFIDRKKKCILIHISLTICVIKAERQWIHIWVY